VRTRTLSNEPLRNIAKVAYAEIQKTELKEKNPKNRNYQCEMHDCAIREHGPKGNAARLFICLLQRDTHFCDGGSSRLSLALRKVCEKSCGPASTELRKQLLFHQIPTRIAVQRVDGGNARAPNMHVF
jgi:hypothetical protein